MKTRTLPEGQYIVYEYSEERDKGPLIIFTDCQVRVTKQFAKTYFIKDLQKKDIIHCHYSFHKIEDLFSCDDDDEFDYHLIYIGIKYWSTLFDKRLFYDSIVQLAYSLDRSYVAAYIILEDFIGYHNLIGTNTGSFDEINDELFSLVESVGGSQKISFETDHKYFSELVRDHYDDIKRIAIDLFKCSIDDIEELIDLYELFMNP